MQNETKTIPTGWMCVFFWPCYPTSRSTTCQGRICRGSNAYVLITTRCLIALFTFNHTLWRNTCCGISGERLLGACMIWSASCWLRTFAPSNHHCLLLISSSLHLHTRATAVSPLFKGIIFFKIWKWCNCTPGVISLLVPAAHTCVWMREQCRLRLLLGHIMLRTSR